MARSRSWAENQQPGSQYSQGQYIFNVTIFGLIIVGLIALLIWWYRWSDAPAIHLITVNSESSTLLNIPFQQNDFSQLESTLLSQKLESTTFSEQLFNDRPTFDRVAANIKDLECKPGDTTVIVCSAIGQVVDSTPMLTATDQTMIPVELVLNSIANHGAANRILILDCGHDYARPEVYFQNEFQRGKDFNSFVAAVEELVKTLETPDRPIWVITSTGPGEIPLYSFNRQRTLFSSALEQVMMQGHQGIDQFHRSLVDYCHQHGGEAAQTPLLFQSGVGQSGGQDFGTEARIPKFAKQPSEAPESDDGAPVETALSAPETKKKLLRLKEFFAAAEMVAGEFANQGIRPEEFATSDWDKKMSELAQLSSNLRQSGAGDFSITEIDVAELNPLARRLQEPFYPPGLFPSAPPIELSPEDEEKIAIARAFGQYQRAKFQAKYYAAMLDDLSWLYDNRLESLESGLAALNELIEQLGPLFSAPMAKLEDTEDYRQAERQLVAAEKKITDRLKSFCRRLGDLHGLTREMAIMALIQSPLIQNGPAEAPAADQREALIQLLQTAEEDDSSGSVPLNTADMRLSNSEIRYRIYQRLQSFCTPPENQLLSQRKLDAAAYYVQLGESPLQQPIRFQPREKIYTASVAPEAEYRSGTIIGMYSGDESLPGGKEINIGLSATTPNGKVDLECQVDPDSPFVIYDPGQTSNRGKSILIKDSVGKIGVYAEQDLESYHGDLQRFTLNVKIKQTSQSGITLTGLAPTLDLPLKLPSENRVDLFVKLGDSDEVKIDPDGLFSLRPWPNRATPFRFLASNNWHQKRNLIVSVYACLPGETESNRPIISGAINESVRQRTRAAIANGTRLPMLRGTLEVGPSIDGKPAQPVEVQWDPPAKPDDPAAQTAAVEPFTQGLCVQIVDPDQEKPWEFWLPVFPQTREYVSVLASRPGNALRLTFRKIPELENRTVKLTLRLVDNAKHTESVVGKFELSTLEQAEELSELIGKVSEASQPYQTFLYIDVDDWPRRIPLVWNGQNFINPGTVKNSRFPNVTISDLRLQSEAAEVSDFQHFESDDGEVAHVFGHRTEGDRPAKLYGRVEINCMITPQKFFFPNTADEMETYGDYCEVKFGEKRKSYPFPRKVESILSTDPETGIWQLRCSVSDFPMVRTIDNDVFDIDPIHLKNGETIVELSNDDKTRIIFDGRAPLRPALKILNSAQTLDPKQKTVEFYLDPVSDYPGGIGIESSPERLVKSVKCYVQNKPFVDALPTEGFLIPRSRDGETFELELPEAAPGNYYLGVQLCDRLGNSVDCREPQPFRVVAPTVNPPPEVKPEVKPDQPKPPPPPPTHTLLVKVRVASRSLRAEEDPDLVLDPDHASPSRRGDTFEFSGLKGGVPYKIEGKLKLTTGFGLETEGKTGHQFDETAKTKITKTKILTLQAK